MRKYLSLTKRDCLVFVRDRAAVFFSLLTMLIILLLCGVFLKGINVNEVTNLLQNYCGIRDEALDLENANHLVEFWTLAGILTVNSITISLTVIGVMVNDVADNRLESFYCAPVDKKIIALAYISAATMISTAFDLLTLVLGEAYIGGTGGTLLPLQSILKIVGMIVLNALISSIVMYFVAMFVKSSSAWSGMATLVGTLVGFVGAIYLPMGNLPEKVAEVLKYTPLLHSTALMRAICCEAAMNETFSNVPTQLLTEYQNYMGITVTMKDEIVGSVEQILFILSCGIAAFIAISIVTGRKKMNDR